MRALGDDPAVRVVVLRAEGRGFNAGVDIKEMQATEGYDALIGANRGCYAAFAAVYECAVPVIAAVHGFCLGGGIGLVGNADIIVAVRRRHLRAARGRPGRARRRHPPGPARAAAQDAGDGLHVGHGHRRRAAPLRLGARGRARATSCAPPPARSPAQIAAKSPTVIRAAKESLNGIDPVDVKRSYRFEQGFTFELNLAGVADEPRDAFVDKRDAEVRRAVTRCRQAHDRGRGRRRAAPTA